MTLTVKVKKTGNFKRLIAIPKTLSKWAMSHEWRPITETNAQKKIGTVNTKHPTFSNLSMASFRKSFAAAMEQVGAEHETIDAHAGRYQSSVLAKHYLRDRMRAVRLMRPYVCKAFDNTSNSEYIFVVK